MLQLRGASIYRRFILIALPVPVISKPMAWYAERILRFILPLLPVERVLMDRGFYDFKLFNRLQYSSTFSMGKAVKQSLTSAGL